MIKIGLFGYSGSGKTTLFKKLTGKEEETTPFKPVIGKGIFFDSRLKKITEILKPKKTVYLEFEFFDIKGFPEGSGFPINYFKNFLNVDLIIYVVGNFKNGSNPSEQIASLEMELIFSDLEKLEKIIESRKEEKTKGKNFSLEQEKVLEKSLEILKKEKPLTDLSEQEKKYLEGFELLTTKKTFVFINGKQKNIEIPLPFICEDVFALELEEFYNKIITSISFIVFFTIKGDIVQAWAIPEGLEAKKAAGKIHTDIEKGFIKAAVLPYKDFIDIGSWKKAKNMGALKFLGPNSFISNGDIVEFFYH